MAKPRRKSRRAAGGDGRFKEGNEVGKKTQWVPGQSGNPLGLPKDYAHVRELAREYTGNAIRALVEIANNPKHAARHQAAKILLDRGYGMADQELKVVGPKGGAMEVKHEVKDADPNRIAGIVGILGRVGALATAEAAAGTPPADDAEADQVDSARTDDSAGGVPPP